MSQAVISAMPQQHRFYEDLLALPPGTLMISFAIVLYAKATLLTGGAAGLALNAILGMNHKPGGSMAVS
ncbi:hypothetical protein [Bosea beijingensis]|uniref:hypothetical protein n=1 Tax=Bosea beijingensis TaxID=3068632 RepID=UPI0027404388|nr:hypothetical protein [Bosea sp. REN20]